MTAGQIIAATINKSIRYDTLTAFDPVALVATGSFLIVTRPDFAAGSVKDLVAAAKSQPGKIVFASPGFGATQHFAAELFKQTAGVNMMAAAGHPNELRVHLKGALKNGCTMEQIQDVLLLLALYCGIPVANEAHRVAAEVFREEKLM